MRKTILFTAALLLGTAAVAQPPAGMPMPPGAPDGAPPTNMPMPGDAGPPPGGPPADSMPMPPGGGNAMPMPQGGSNAMPAGGAPMASNKTYPKCSRTMRDNCTNASAGRRR